MSEIVGIDPRDCGCTDCLTGRTVPLDAASAEQIAAMLKGQIANRTSEEFTVLLTVRPTEPDLPPLTWELEEFDEGDSAPGDPVSYTAERDGVDLEITPRTLRYAARRLERGQRVVELPAHGWDPDEKYTVSISRPRP